MNSSRPYLVRALIDWIVDNALTPYVVIQCDIDGVVVPEAYVNDGKIVLNVSSEATRDFAVEQDVIHFDSRFSGEVYGIRAPIGAVVAVYAKENGAGMAFEPVNPDTPPDTPPDGKPNLRVV